MDELIGYDHVEAWEDHHRLLHPEECDTLEMLQAYHAYWETREQTVSLLDLVEEEEGE